MKAAATLVERATPLIKIWLRESMVEGAWLSGSRVLFCRV